VSTDGSPRTWWQCEPRRLARDQHEVSSWCPDLQWVAQGAGGWTGQLPRWPFERPEPDGLVALIGKVGMPVFVIYGHGYPMVPPSVFSLDPEPQVTEWTLHRWHVNGDGSLCLLQDDVMWEPRQSVVDLLLKAAGWRIEYALVKAGVVDGMSPNGIVTDGSRDDLIASAAGDEVGTPKAGS